MRRVFLLIIGIAVMALVFGGYTVYDLSARNPRLTTQDPLTTARFYALGNPSLEGAASHGEGPITIVGQIDLTSETSRRFEAERLDALLDEPGVRYHHKNYLTLGDIEQRNGRYLYSKSIWCAGEEGIAMMRLILSQQPSDLNAAATALGLDVAAFTTCLDSTDPESLLTDAIESEHRMAGILQQFYIGIEGTDNTVIDGIPSPDRLSRELAIKRLTIGY